MTDRVSIHVCIKDRATEPALLLESLRKQTFQDWDLVIVDDSRPIPIAQSHQFMTDIINRLKTENHNVIYSGQQVPLGVCQARNFAHQVDDTGNPITCRIDDDSICEPDYLERLVKILNKNKNIGAVGGVVPTYGAPPIHRNPKVLNGIFNKLEYDKEGNIKYLADDGGFLYNPNKVLPSHHLRSSFMYYSNLWKKVGGYPLNLGTVGFREETIFSMKLKELGWNMLTDTGAIAWHLRCPSGGCRSPDYMNQVKLADEVFKKWAKRLYKLRGNLFV